MSRVWSGRRDHPAPLAVAPAGPVVSTRCLLDERQPGRPVDGPRSHVCSAHRDRLDEMLDPAQPGQMHHKPDERRIPPSIPVLVMLLPTQRGRSGNPYDPVAGAYRSTPPAPLAPMVHRDPRSEIGDDGPYDDRNAEMSILGALAAIAVRLDLRDIHRAPVAWPRHPVQLAVWLHHRIDHLCGVDWVGDVWDDLGRLHRQLLGQAGDAPARPLGPCRRRVNTDGRLDDAGEFVCKAPLHLPGQGLKGMDEDVHLPAALDCRACGGSYPRHELIVLARDHHAEQARLEEERKARRRRGAA